MLIFCMKAGNILVLLIVLNKTRRDSFKSFPRDSSLKNSLITPSGSLHLPDFRALNASSRSLIFTLYTIFINTVLKIVTQNIPLSDSKSFKSPLPLYMAQMLIFCMKAANILVLLILYNRIRRDSFKSLPRYSSLKNFSYNSLSGVTLSLDNSCLSMKSSS